MTNKDVLDLEFSVLELVEVTKDALREMEWSKLYSPVWGGSHNESDTVWLTALPHCPLCGGLKPGEICWDWVSIGHRDDCKLAALLLKLEERSDDD